MGDNIFTNPNKSTRQIVQTPLNPHSTPHLEAMVLVPATIQHEQKEKQEKCVEEETDEVLIRELAAKASRLHKEYGQVVASLLFSHDKKRKELTISNKVVNELRAKETVISAQLIESKEQNLRFNDEIEEIKGKAELKIQQAKSEESIWRNKFMELNEEQTALKKESEEKDNNIRVLLEKDRDNESKIAQQNVEVLNFEMSERKLKKDLDGKEKQLECFSKKVTRLEINIKEEEEKVHNLVSSERKLKEEVEGKDSHIEILERKLEKKYEQILKMEDDFDKITTTNKELHVIIVNYVKKENANEIAMQGLETNFKLRVQELEANISEKSNQIIKMSNEMDKEREGNKVDQEKINEQVKVLCEQVIVLKRGDKVTIKKLKTERDELKLRVEDLKTELKSLKKQNDDLRTNFRTILETAQSSVIPDKPNEQCKQTVSCSSSSSKEETSLKSSSSSNTEDGDNENNGSSTHSETKRLEPLVVPKLSPNKTPGKRKNPPKIVSCALKKQREDATSSTDQNGPQNKLITFTEISRILFNEKSSTEANTEIPEKCSKSQSTRSISRRQQGNQNDNTL